jgi:regulator of protease activity HflC (stomatin/prohibitin superfamily)
MPTLDSIVQFIIDCIRVFQFWVVVDEDEEAVVLRNGKFHKHLTAGLHWTRMFYLDRARVIKMTPDTHNLTSQILTTRDNVQITCALMVEFCIRDAKKALLKVQDRDGVIRDSSLVECAALVQSNDWETVRSPYFAELMTEGARKRAFRYGVEIMSVKFTDCSTTFSHTQTVIGS